MNPHLRPHAAHPRATTELDEDRGTISFVPARCEGADPSQCTDPTCAERCPLAREETRPFTNLADAKADHWRRLDDLARTLRDARSIEGALRRERLGKVRLGVRKRDDGLVEAFVVETGQVIANVLDIERSGGVYTFQDPRARIEIHLPRGEAHA